MTEEERMREVERISRRTKESVKIPSDQQRTIRIVRFRTTFNYADDSQLRYQKKILEERKSQAEQLKINVEEWLNTIPPRMQRIIKYKVFEELTWQQVAGKMGRRATEEGIRKEFNRFFEKK